MKRYICLESLPGQLSGTVVCSSANQYTIDICRPKCLFSAPGVLELIRKHTFGGCQKAGKLKIAIQWQKPGYPGRAGRKNVFARVAHVSCAAKGDRVSQTGVPFCR